MKEVSEQTIPDHGTAHPIFNHLLHLSHNIVSSGKKNSVLASSFSIPNSKTL